MREKAERSEEKALISGWADGVLLGSEDWVGFNI